MKRVVIVGRDAAAWVAALAVQRALGRTGVSVQVVELPPLVQRVDVYSAVPSIKALHKLLGLSEAAVIGACSAVPMVGQRFANWSKSRPPFVHGYDGDRTGEAGPDVLQLWVKARGEGLRVEFEDFSIGASAAKQGRVPIDGSGSGSLSASYGYHVDASAYVALLRHGALRSGVLHTRGGIGSVEREADRIASILLDDGTRIEGDIYIDASGVQAALIGGVAGAEFESWAEWLPCNRILAASGQRLDPLPAFSQISANRGGWVGLFPLQDRTGVVSVYDSGSFSDAEMQQNLAVLAGLEIAGDAVVAPFAAGMRARPWIGNCVAIGEAAISLEPLDGVQLHLLHVGVSHLMTLFPLDAEEMPEAAAYNAALAAHGRNIRDFQAAHYKLNRRFDEPLWDRAREAPGPEGLDYKIKLFESRGYVAMYDDESFQEQNWAAILLGHGVVPRSYDRRIDLVPQQEQMQQMQQRLRDIAGEVKAMPAAADFVSHFERSRAEAVRA